MPPSTALLAGARPTAIALAATPFQCTTAFSFDAAAADGSADVPVGPGRDGFDDADESRAVPLGCERGLRARRRIEDEEADLVLGNMDGSVEADARPPRAPYTSSVPATLRGTHIT